MQKFRIRLATFHTGYNLKKSTTNRKVLENKRVFYWLMPINYHFDNQIFLKKIQYCAGQFYDNFYQTPLIIGGDGAAWIKKLAQDLPNGLFVLDKFHAMRYLKQLSNIYQGKDSQTLYLQHKAFFEQGDFISLYNSLKKLIYQVKSKNKLQRIITYFENNAHGIINQSLVENIGVSIEGDISHIVKWLLGYGSKAFSYLSFDNILSLRVAEVNQVNVFNDD